ncbi:ArsC family reductase [Sodalis sp. RH19]|uniref:ArsC family reductase n=1 Tax=Sodalis sp. RH19 TaxID=3394334 RepID=UPI0039B6D947
MADPDVAFTLYGIKNCDTIKKARRWLDERQVAYRFHDYRVDGVDRGLVQGFADGVGWQALLNTRGTTWRKLSDAERQAAEGAVGALALMVGQPAVIKRPVLQSPDGRLMVGFDAEGYQLFITHKEA